MPPQLNDVTDGTDNHNTKNSIKSTTIGYSSTIMVDQYPDIEPLIGQQQQSNGLNRRKSFIRTFVTTNGPPQIIIVCIMLAVGFGSTIGVVPAVMTDRYAILYHNYTDTSRDCSSYSATAKSATNGSSSSGGTSNSKTNHTKTTTTTLTTNSHDTDTIKPQACYDASADAQNGVAIEQMLSNIFTFLTSSYVGAFSDVHGRKGMVQFYFIVFIILYLFCL
jgi:hypothetical protein